MGKYSFLQLIIMAICVAGAIGVLLVILGVMGIAIPGWIWTIGWILLAVVVGVFVVRFISTLM